MKQRSNPSRQRPRHHRGLQLRPLAISLLCAGLSPAIAQVLPTGFLPIAGGVTMSQAGAAMNINQPFARGIASWQTFSIGVGGVVNIVQPSASSVLLNRVTGNELSTIAGQLNANGRVILINPNGVMFSQGAAVNVGGLIASTLALTTSDKSFMDGATKLTFERADLNSAEVRNLGSITATGGGPVVLMGAAVGNGSTGTITADNGTVALASGRRITLDLVGDGLTNLVIAPDAMATHAAVSNSGTIQADGGRVALVGSSVTAGELVVNQTGTVRARSIGTRNGEIILGGGRDNQVAMTGGTLDATGDTANERGGSIRIAAGQVQLQANDKGQQAVVDASGLAGGGTVAVRGYDVALSSGSVLRANATGQGAGGTIDVGTATGQVLVDGLAAPERESHAQVFGELSARGAGSGAGGAITTSGDFLRINPSKVDAGGGAQGGANGRWTVAASSNLDVVAAADIPAYDSTYPPLSITNVSAESVGGALGRGTDVTLSSTNIGDNAGVRIAADAKVVKSEGGTATLRVDSAGSIVMATGSAINAGTGALHVDFNADSTGRVAQNAAQINSGSGPVTELDYAGSIRLDGATINANGGSVRFFGQSDAANGRAIGGSASHTDEPADSWRDGVYLNASSVTTSGSGQVSMRGQGRSWVSDPSGTGGFYVGSGGVVVTNDSAVQAGTGGVSLDGVAGFGASGVAVRNGAKVVATGDIALTGRGATWSDTMPAAGAGSSTAVLIDAASVASDRNVRIDGTGADLDGFRTSKAFAAQNDFAGSSQGVSIYGSVTAGEGQRIDVNGRAGNQSFTSTLDDSGNIVVTPFGQVYGVVVRANEALPNPLRTSGGTIAIDGQGTDVSLRMETFGSGSFALAAAPEPGALAAPPQPALLSVMSETGKGGNISVRGRNIVIDGAEQFGDVPLVGRLDASGATGGGSIDIAATGVIAVGANASLEANATGSGNGGSVKVVAGDSLRAYGSLSARGGAEGGNGGFIETSAAQFDLAGIRADASAPVGSAGSWLIDPFDVDIVSGVATGSLTGNPFDPIAASTIQDGDINAALNAGTSVTIGTGSTGSPLLGDIHMSNAKGAVNINYSTNKGPVTFQLDANRSVRGDAGTVIQSTGGGALNVVFNADVNNGGTATGGGQISYSGDIYTNGGNVVMNGSWANPSNQGVSVHLDGNEIDTRVGRSDAGAGGSVTIVGKSIGLGGIGDAAVAVDGVHISTSTGNVNITGTAEGASGVRLGSRFVATGIPNRQTEITSTTGNITVLGVGNSVTSAGTTPGHGVIIDQSALRSVDGDITVRGLRQAGGPTVGDGVRLTTGAQVVTSGTGDIELSGQSVGNGAGVRVGPQAALGGAVPPVLADVIVSAGGNTVLRAGNDGSTDALVIDGKVSAANVINLRPGGVDAAGNGVDQTGTPITLGGTAATGFAVSAAEFGRLTAPTIVAGSNAHAANIDVVGPLTLPSALTLQNGGGGNIQLGGAITATRLGLLSAGNITQAAGAPITAGTLMARSTGGSVLLDTAPNNVSAATVGGGAAGAFRYVDVDTVQLGSVSVTGFDAASNAPQVQSATSMAADTVFVRTLSGDLLLGTNVSSTSGTDLVAASRFQNLGAYTITGAPWRVWADTWVGETRGGLFGSGPLPNLFHCAYLGLCTVTVSPGDNHFIYAQQPVATVVIGNATRPAGQANPPFTYTVAGLILGDTASSFSGAPGTSATPDSPPGLYAINGSFASAAGYAVNVRPGDLTVTEAPPPSVVLRLPDFPKPDVLREVPSTWLYDRNIGPPPICFATGALEGDRASQGGDVLAREWSRVRSRPNLSSCVDTEKRNGCADF